MGAQAYLPPKPLRPQAPHLSGRHRATRAELTARAAEAPPGGPPATLAVLVRLPSQPEKAPGRRPRGLEQTPGHRACRSEC